MNYSIGQILYVLLNRETKICPVQVVEEITKRTLGGETTTYIVKFGKKGETVSLSDLDGQVFESVDVLRQTLHDRITRSVENIITNTVEKAQEWYPQTQIVENVVNVRQSEVLEVQQQEEDAMITLPDGTIAKIRMPFPGM
jgi:ribosome-associated translation inhibitor RaiA